MNIRYRKHDRRWTREASVRLCAKAWWFIILSSWCYTSSYDSGRPALATHYCIHSSEKHVEWSTQSGQCQLSLKRFCLTIRAWCLSLLEFNRVLLRGTIPVMDIWNWKLLPPLILGTCWSIVVFLTCLHVTVLGCIHKGNIFNTCLGGCIFFSTMPFVEIICEIKQLLKDVWVGVSDCIFGIYRAFYPWWVVFVKICTSTAEILLEQIWRTFHNKVNKNPVDSKYEVKLMCESPQPDNF